MIFAPKGTKDVLPQDSVKWRYVENICREAANLFGAKEIRTPTFEHTELFLRGIGETTDVVNKEMYTFTDKGGRSITLKPEGTAGVVRAFVENGLMNSAMPLKTYYISSVFRYERPQNGRLREHHQFGVEFFGSSSAMTDAEVISLAREILNGLGIDASLSVNSMGCPKCRKAYNEALKAFLAENYDSLCETCKTRFEKNPLRILDCKEENCKKLVANAPKITDFLCDDCRGHFEELQNCLRAAGVEFTVNPSIVRGLDYYTGTVFEFVTDKLGAQGTVCGGGRYDGLVGEIGGSPCPAVGFGMGIERAMLLMDAFGARYPEDAPAEIYIAPMGEAAKKEAFGATIRLRRGGIKAETDLVGRGIKAQFKYADKICARFVAVLGDDELASGNCSVKRMSDGAVFPFSVAGLSDASAVMKIVRE